METVMHEYKHHDLKSGRSGKKVSNPKQAIAIGLSEARRSGANIPESPRKAGGKKAAKKKTPAKKTTGKNTASKKTAGKKTATKKRGAKKTAAKRG
jgi:topoisomerase IA-like protein